MHYKNRHFKVKLILIVIFIICILFSSSVVYAKDYQYVIPGGDAIGLKLDTGVYVAGKYQVNTNNNKVTPWKNSDIEEGDLILSCNGISVLKTSDLNRLVQNTEKANIALEIQRESFVFTTNIDVVKTINQLPGKNRQLRVLDSLLYYTTDIIHLEVDSKQPIDEAYTAKEKSYYKNATVAYVSLSVGLISLIMSILGLCLSWKLHVVVHLVFWFVFAIGVILALVFNTRKTLSYRAGANVEPSEYVVLKDKIEYYNM